MFADLTYLHIYDNESDDEEADEDHNQPSSSSTSIEKMFVWMGDIMQEIINEVKKGGVQFIDHTTSLLHVIATDVQGIRL